jgi:hypothetical protein
MTCGNEWIRHRHPLHINTRITRFFLHTYSIGIWVLNFVFLLIKYLVGACDSEFSISGSLLALASSLGSAMEAIARRQAGASIFSVCSSSGAPDTFQCAGTVQHNLPLRYMWPAEKSTPRKVVLAQSKLLSQIFGCSLSASSRPKRGCGVQMAAAESSGTANEVSAQRARAVSPTQVLLLLACFTEGMSHAW